MFGAEAYADEASGDAAEVGEALEEFEEPGEGQGLGAAEHPADYVVLDDQLEALGGAGWEHSSCLDGVEFSQGGRAAEEGGAEDVGGGYGVLDG